MLLSDNFFMNAKILDSTQFYKFDFHKKVVTQKNLPLQAFATSTLRNSIGRRALKFSNETIYEVKIKTFHRSSPIRVFVDNWHAFKGLLISNKQMNTPFYFICRQILCVHSEGLFLQTLLFEFKGLRLIW